MSTTATKPHIDQRAFLASLDQVRIARGLKWYGVFRTTHVTNIQSAVHGKKSLGPQALNTLATWAGLDLGKYVESCVQS